MSNELIKRIGITGQNGFIGSHLYNTLILFKDEFILIDFKKEYFESETLLDEFVLQCDVIVHLAAMNRHESEEVIYNTNVGLVESLICSLKRTKSQAHVIISSSTQEERDNLYGKSKREGREALNRWSKECGGKLTGLVIPNVYGAFGVPFYNSFIATFCYQLTHNETPNIASDSEVRLIYVQELVTIIIQEIRKGKNTPLLVVEPTSIMKVSTVLSILTEFKNLYFNNGVIPKLTNQFEHNLFNTFRSFIDYKNHYPIKFTQHTDSRGAFVEVIRLGIGGQCSFSTTVSGVTRGNHFHTRKIERFAVIKGKALIQLRKIDSNEIMDFFLDGDNPAFVDMPIWYTHNIKNIGDDELYTIFWIDEPYNPDDADTYFMEV